MLDIIYYPVSFILWCWHAMFGALLGGASAFGWALAIVFLVWTLRALLLRPAIGQARFLRRMQRAAPAIQALQRRYADDSVLRSKELQKVFAEHRVNPVTGYLPVLLQLPVFIGLAHVLRSFMAAGTGQGNYVFSAADVQSYLAAKVFGAHLGDAIVTTPWTDGAAGAGLWLWQAMPVAVPLIVLVAIASHLAARLAMRGQPTAAGPMRWLGLYGVPAVGLVFGAFLPIGLLVYWLSNSLWTIGQQQLVHRRLGDP